MPVSNESIVRSYIAACGPATRAEIANELYRQSIEVGDNWKQAYKAADDEITNLLESEEIEVYDNEETDKALISYDVR